MRLLPLFVFWCLWFLNFLTRTSLSPILPLIEDSLSLSHGEAGGLITSYSMGYATTLLIAGRFVSVWGYKRKVVARFIGIGMILVVLQWVEVGAIISSGVIFGMGGAPLLLGIIADYLNFQTGILWIGILTNLSL